MRMCNEFLFMYLPHSGLFLPSGCGAYGQRMYWSTKSLTLLAYS